MTSEKSSSAKMSKHESTQLETLMLLLQLSLWYIKPSSKKATKQGPQKHQNMALGAIASSHQGALKNVFTILVFYTVLVQQAKETRALPDIIKIGKAI